MSEKNIRCIIRKIPVEATPEELVRQELLFYMINSLGFPEGCIAVEKSLKQMPHILLSDQEIPDRRIDIVCFTKSNCDEYGLIPLLLIECKAVKLTPKVINQVSGYNHYVGAPYIAVVNGDSIKFGWIDPTTKKYNYIDYLPKYDKLKTI